MCLTCGCGVGFDDHGDPRHITDADLAAAADAAGITPAAAAGNILAARTPPTDPVAAFVAAATRPTIVCDIDGVLAFFAETMTTVLNAHFGLSLLASELTSYRVEDTLDQAQRDWWATQLGRGVLYSNVAPDYSGIGALNAIHAAGYHVIISSDRPTTAQTATRRWLARWRVAHDEVILAGKGGKRRVLADYGPDDPAVLIDDDPTKAITVARPGVEVWAPTRPWIPTSSYPNWWVFGSWAQVLARLGVDHDVSIPMFSTDSPANPGVPSSPRGEI